MKNNYTKQQIEEILDTITNPKEFAGFITRIHQLCTHQISEYPEEGGYFILITDDIMEAIRLYKNPQEAKRKYQEVEDAYNKSYDTWIEEQERLMQETLMEEEERFHEWFNSLTTEQQEEYSLTGHVTIEKL